MNPLQNIFRYLNRLRHSRGFGIHSPYAFRFVNDVIRPKSYGYYAYDTIDADPLLPASMANKAKWLVRIAVFIGINRFIILLPGVTLETSSLAQDLTLNKPEGKASIFSQPFFRSLRAASRALGMTDPNFVCFDSYSPKPADLVILPDYYSFPSEIIKKYQEGKENYSELKKETTNSFYQDLINKVFESGIPLLAIKPGNELRTSLQASRPFGLLLEDKSKILLIPRKEMAFTAYLIKF